MESSIGVRMEEQLDNIARALEEFKEHQNFSQKMVSMTAIRWTTVLTSPGMSSAPAHKRRSLPQNNGGIAAADKNRAKGSRPNTAGAGAEEHIVHSDPLPSPAADRTGSLLMCPRANAPPIAKESSGPSALGNRDAAPLANNDDDAGVKGAQEFLSFLKTMDCSSDAALLRLRGYVEGRLSFELALCLSTEMGGHVQYYLKVGGQLSTIIGADPKERPQQPKADEEQADKLNMECALGEKRIQSAATMHPDHQPVYLSGYLMPLGEVFVAHRLSKQPQEVGSTNFFVLMEAASAKKSLWMVCRYEKLVRRKDGTNWGTVAGVTTGNTVCLLDDIKEWRNPTEGMIDMGPLAEALPDGGSNVLQPVFYTSVLTCG
ncbi:hypothetical protein N657DRAFT_634307 [Parathielavia appendiculata]|uniref:Uncharacterized protein n=1 Tax=Parathielavia appendiculata TaxID=2587402 RepID=A0AAN6TZP4_9PEZI|nr:hypothetical protein N657DRAFT_634307 [Parathielavia appendiculata]